MIANRSWTLQSRPAGALSLDDFALIEAELAEPDLDEGELFVRNHAFAVAPTIRNWLNESGGSYRGSVPLGGTIPGMAGCEVLVSRHHDYPVGSRIVAMSRWSDYAVIAPDKSPVPVFAVTDGMPFEEALVSLSPNALTAYFGLLEVGRPIAGETVLVSGAAGSVGSTVCQIARIMGCRVIAVAGGRQKCEWLVETCGVDAAIDYRSEEIGTRLAELCPNGIDVVFDNVGGDFLQAAVDNIAPHGRIVLCGQISAYDSPDGAPGPRDMMKLVYGRVRMEGFVVGDFVDRSDEAHAALSEWIAAGQLVTRADIRQGLDRLPGSLVDLFSGNNNGSLIVIND